MKRKIVLLLILLLLTLTGCSSKKESNQPEYYCQEGELRANNCAVAVSKDAALTCEDGFKLDNGTCTKVELVPAVPAKTCEEGFHFNDKKQCISDETYDKDILTTCEIPSDIAKGTIKVLESGSIITTQNEAYIDGGTCYLTYWKNYNETLKAYSTKETIAIAFKTTKTCPSDTIEYKGKCYKTSEPIDTLVCEEGFQTDDECLITSKKAATITCLGDNFLYNEKTNRCERIDLIQALQK